MGMDQRFGRGVALSIPRARMPVWTIAVAMVAGVLLAVPMTGHASGDAVDQSLPGSAIPSVLNSTRVMAETFTAGITGQIDKVSLSLESHSNLVTGWLEIRTVGAGGTPNGGTQQPTSTPIQFAYPFGNPSHDFTISPAVPITAGTQYAIVWTTRVGTAYWWGTTFNAYSGGQGWLACINCGWTAQPTRDFAFATWVVAGTSNQPAVVAADHPAVSVNEGPPGANTGTYSDADGDTVVLTASSGSITKTGTSSGTWSWHTAAGDEAGTQFVTITANDGNGVASATTFPLNVAPVAPVARVTAPSSTVPEGTAFSVTGSAISPSVEDNTIGFGYGWNVTKNGNAYATGTGRSWHFTPDDNGTYVVTVTATDDGSMSDTAAVTITGTNVWPTAHISGVTYSVPLVVTPNESIGFTGNFTDPGIRDTHTARWNFGDGGTSSASFGAGGSGNTSASHSYAAAGTYHVSLTVTDKDGGAGVASATVVVQTPQQALTSIQSYVNSISTLNKGQKYSLIAKLDAASASAARGNNLTAHNQMSAFLNEVRADAKTGKISGAQQTTLTAAIHAVEAAIGTYNRMLQWWPLEP
jgi:PKD domain-containing protein/Big-like domain-containing protein